MNTSHLLASFLENKLEGILQQSWKFIGTLNIWWNHQSVETTFFFEEGEAKENHQIILYVPQKNNSQTYDMYFFSGTYTQSTDLFEYTNSDLIAKDISIRGVNNVLFNNLYFSDDRFAVFSHADPVHKNFSTYRLKIDSQLYSSPMVSTSPVDAISAQTLSAIEDCFWY